MSCESQPQQQYQEKDLTSSDKISNFQAHQLISISESLEKNEGSKLSLIINQGTDAQFQNLMPEIATNISNRNLINSRLLHHRLFKLFYKVIKNSNLQKESQEYPLFLLSLLAEMVRQNPSIKLPFTKKIVVSMLSLNIEYIQDLKQASKIVQILSILIGNMSQQGKLMIRLGLVDQVWKSLILLFSKTDDLFALRILLKAFLEFTSTTQINFSPWKIAIKNIISKVSDIFGLEIANEFKIRLTRPKSKYQNGMTLWDLVIKRK